MKYKPFLKWAGGKYRCIEQILQHLPKGTRLIEPFTGSGAVFLNAPHENFFLAEANADLIALYRHLQTEGQPFIQYCSNLFKPHHNEKTQYYVHRQLFNQTKIGSRRRAALFLYLNRHGYNGLCRYNLSGLYNVPFGRYKKPYFPEQELLHFHQKSQSVTFAVKDFKETFLEASQGDVIYCDPPYAPLSKTSQFTSYTMQKFSETDQITLAKLAEHAANQNIPVIISNHDTPFTRKLYQHAELVSFPVQRYISCKGSHRNPVRELVAIFR